MAEPRRIEGPTPAGGVYAIAYESTDEEGAPALEIVEYAADGRAIARTYGHKATSGSETAGGATPVACSPFRARLP